ncbi:MAG: tRNA (N6-isopentenyl adenosine(37)-C2)-methylthiotransferase MiaB [Candidatus Latescibacteria bacterium]|nr:tRNA (N6-isopentenyl adenosine(37)-C2)-methylthiotransferase MiaB [Candidatus Latescibacterota bacterium]
MKTVYIETYGCQMNVADSEMMAGVLTKAGYGLTESAGQADVILINTCAIREHAEARVFGRLAELQRYRLRRPEMVIGLCGCMAKHLGEKLTRRAPYVDFIASPDAYRRLPDLIRKTADDEALMDLRLDREEVYAGVDPVRKHGVSAWLTVMRGCDKFCSFCVVPFVRGRERSVPPDEVERQVRLLAEEGYKEVTLLGQTVNAYRYDETDFADLLERLGQIDGVERIRFTSPHPSDFSEKLLNVIAGNPKVCKHLHLPVQAGSDRILERMRRSYTVEAYCHLVENIREKMPEVGLTTDIIVGFCGETEEDFEKTCDLIRWACYDSAFMFTYSPRDGTSAYRDLVDDVPDDEKVRRLQHLIDLQEGISLEINRGLIGRRVEVLVEGQSRRDAEKLFGKIGTFKTVVFPQMGERPGDIVEVEIVGATSHTLLGERAIHRRDQWRGSVQ